MASNTMTTFENNVKDKLKSMVAELIPEDRYEEIVRATIADFERNDLPKMVKEEMTKQYKDKLNAYFGQPEWQSYWDNNGQAIASQKVKELIMAVAPDLLAALFGNQYQCIVNDLRTRIVRY
jgi:hypothetical protein